MPNMLTQEDLNAIGLLIEKKNDVVLEAVNDGFTAVESRLTNVEDRLINVEDRLINVEDRLTNVESEMVTKDFLERRLAKTDGKVNALVNVLEKKCVVTEDEKRSVLH